ncbi:MAG: SDR family NAD(P)-dependent oxidoreductase [Syntrophobacteraceae bacterium]
MKLDLSGKTALVTGGARGIGEAVSRTLASAGATVLVNFNRSGDQAVKLREELRSRGNGCELFQADISDPAQVESLFRRIGQEYGGLDILVNNAGITRDTLLLTMKLSDWESVQQVNLRGAFLTTRMAAEFMVPRHGGKIINIASVAANAGGRGQTNYAASKGGLVAFTRACAVELAPKGILVNAVLPGVIETQMSSRMRKRAGDILLGRIPLQRFGSAQDVADLVLFLASDKSDYLTGQAISLDGGLSIS